MIARLRTSCFLFGLSTGLLICTSIHGDWPPFILMIFAALICVNLYYTFLAPLYRDP